MGNRLSVIFDLDGTLVDTVEDVRDLINPLLAGLGRSLLTREDAARCFGLGAVKFVERALSITQGGPLPASEQQEFIGRFIDLYTTSPPVLSRVLPGVLTGLTQCREAGWRMGVCTNKPLQATDILLKHLDLSQFFDGVSGGDSVPRRKPDPMHLHDAIARVGGSTNRAVMVGDSATDAACARAAGVPVILVKGGYVGSGADDLRADRVIDNFKDIALLIKELDPRTSVLSQ